MSRVDGRGKIQIRAPCEVDTSFHTDTINQDTRNNPESPLKLRHEPPFHRFQPMSSLCYRHGPSHKGGGQGDTSFVTPTQHQASNILSLTYTTKMDEESQHTATESNSLFARAARIHGLVDNTSSKEEGKDRVNLATVDESAIRTDPADEPSNKEEEVATNEGGGGLETDKAMSAEVAGGRPSPTGTNNSGIQDKDTGDGQPVSVHSPAKRQQQSERGPEQVMKTSERIQQMRLASCTKVQQKVDPLKTNRSAWVGEEERPKPLPGYTLAPGDFVIIWIAHKPSAEKFFKETLTPRSHSSLDRSSSSGSQVGSNITYKRFSYDHANCLQLIN